MMEIHDIFALGIDSCRADFIEWCLFYAHSSIASSQYSEAFLGRLRSFAATIDT